MIQTHSIYHALYLIQNHRKPDRRYGSEAQSLGPLPYANNNMCIKEQGFDWIWSLMHEGEHSSVGCWEKPGEEESGTAKPKSEWRKRGILLYHYFQDHC